jgi:HEAT repeat protein
MLSTELLQLLHLLEHGTPPTAVQVTLLSDIARGDLDELRSRWARIPAHLRLDVMERSAALAEDNVDLDFRSLVRVGLDDVDPSVRRAAIEAAWEHLDRDTGRILRELLLRDNEESVRAVAATSLEPYVLATELGEFDEAEGGRIVDALRAAWERPGESVDVRARAIESLGSRSLPWVQTAITDAYYSEDRRLRIAAVRAMGQSADEAWLEYLEETAVSDEPEMRYETAVALGVIGSEAGIELLADLLTDEDGEVVAAAIASLGQVGGEEAIEKLSRLQFEGDEALTEALEEALEAARYAEQGPPDLIRSRIGL